MRRFKPDFRLEAFIILSVCGCSRFDEHSASRATPSASASSRAASLSAKDAAVAETKSIREYPPEIRPLTDLPEKSPLPKSWGDVKGVLTRFCQRNPGDKVVIHESCGAYRVVSIGDAHWGMSGLYDSSSGQLTGVHECGDVAVPPHNGCTVYGRDPGPELAQCPGTARRMCPRSRSGLSR